MQKIINLRVKGVKLLSMQIFGYMPCMWVLTKVRVGDIISVV